MSLEVEHLSFSYGCNKILSDISFTVGDGTLTTIMGPNGVGKTTLFRCVLGLLNKYKGNIRVNSIDISKLSVKELAHHIAYIPQIHRMSFSFSVEDIVLMGTAHQINSLSSPGEKEMTAAHNALKKLDISNLAKKNFTQLSGGEQQLVMIARALAQGSKTILMDEPTASLDYGNQSLVMSYVHTLTKEGYTILLSTHNPQHALWYADQVLAIFGGKVRALGKPENVMNQELIYDLFNVRTSFLKTPQGMMIVPQMDGVC